MKAINMSVQSQFPTLGFLKPIWKGKIENHPETDFKFSLGVISVGQETQTQTGLLGSSLALTLKYKLKFSSFRIKAKTAKIQKKKSMKRSTI